MTVDPGTRYSFWTVVQAAGRAALVRCRCGPLHKVALDALTSGASTSCGCYGPSTHARKEAEQRQRQRHREQRHSWRPTTL